MCLQCVKSSSVYTPMLPLPLPAFSDLRMNSYPSHQIIATEPDRQASQISYVWTHQSLRYTPHLLFLSFQILLLYHLKLLASLQYCLSHLLYCFSSIQANRPGFPHLNNKLTTLIISKLLSLWMFPSDKRNSHPQ